MLSRDTLLKIVDKYNYIFQSEENNIRGLSFFLEQAADADFSSRDNSVGHITVSAVIYNPITDRVLFLAHRGLKKWLQPGGHIEISDRSFIDAAFREVVEETGLGREQLQLMQMPEGMPLLDIDSHYIPERPERGEAPHYHHDIRFLMHLTDSNASVTYNSAESHGLRWVPCSEPPEGCDIGRALAKIPLFDRPYDGRAGI